MAIHARLQQLSTGKSVDAAIALFVVVVIGILWAFVFKTLSVERERVVSSAIQRNDSLAIALERYAVRTIEGVDALLKDLIRRYARDGRDTKAGESSAEYRFEYGALTGFSVADEHGEVIAASPATPGPVNLADREHFQILKERDTGQVLVGKPVQSRASGTLDIPIARRINKPDGTFGGIAIAAIEPHRLNDVLRGSEMLPLDVVAVVGLDGIVRARLQGGKATSGEDVGASAMFRKGNVSPSGHFLEKSERDDVSRFISYRTLKEFGLIAFVGRAESDVMKHFHQDQILWATAAATVLILGFATLLKYALEVQRRSTAGVVRNQARFMTAFDQAAVGIAHTDRAGRYVAVNEQMCHILGYTSAELMELTFADVSHPDDVKAGADFRARLHEDPTGQMSLEGEKRYLRKDGSEVWCLATISAVLDDAGQVEYVLGIVHDISGQKRAEEDLRSRGERLQLLSRQLMEVQEKERHRLGRELHDRVGANLSASALSLAVLRGNMTGYEPASVLRLDDCIQLIRETIVQIRDVLADLRPPALEELGLFAALTHYVSRMAKHADVDIRMEGRECVPRLSPEVEISLFRIAQEALCNAMRHAGAKTITVTLVQNASKVTLTVADDGKGLDQGAPPVPFSRLGMLTMRERAEAVNAHLQVYSPPGGGLRIIVAVRH